MINDYFKDKYLEKARGKIQSFMFVLIVFVFLVASAASANAWYDSNWEYRQEFQIQNDSRLTSNTSFPLKIILNSSYINLSLINSTGQDLRCVDGDDTGLVDLYIEKINITGNTIIYCNYTIQKTTNTTGYLYYGNDDATSVSDFNATFGTTARGVWGYNDAAGGYLDDFSDNNHDFELKNGALYVRNETDIIPRKYGHAWTDGTNDYLLGSIDIDDTTTTKFSVSMWFRPDADKNSVYLFNTREAGTGGFAMIYSSSHVTYGSAINLYVPTTTVDFYSSGYSATDWNHVVVRFNSDLTIAEQWLNGVNLSVAGGDNRPSSAYTPSASNTCIGLHCNAPSTYFDGNIDEPRYYTDFISVNMIQLLYTQPAYSLSAETKDIIKTSVTSGFYDEDYTDVDSVDSGSEFRLWVNYSYNDNSTSVYPGGWCNYSGDYLFKEYYNTSSNTSIYSSVNVTYEMTGLETTGVNNDVVRLKLCRVSGLKDAVWVTNCTGSTTTTISSAEMPLCSNGFLDYGLNITNCNSDSSVNLSVWSTATAPSNAVRLVDGRLGLDRVVNVTSNNMTWNVSLDRFTSDLYESYGYGSVNFDYDCRANISGVENQTGNTAVLGVNNTAPSVVVDEVWYWLLSSPTSFSNGGSYKYPLESTFNVSGRCLDSPGDSLEVQIDLSYANTTLIDSTNFTSPLPSSINYTRGNFTSDSNYLSGVLDYTLSVTCCDNGNLCGSSSGTFSAGNDAPTASWTSSSPLITTTLPVTINWTCSDAELENVSMTSHVWVNDTFNLSTNSRGFVLNGSTGDYDVSVVCEDSFFNSSNASILVRYSDSCMINLVSPCSSCRYRDNVISLDFSCEFGVLDSCGYQIDDYEMVYPVNCSDVNFTAELGRNHFVLWVNTTGGVNETKTIDFYAKKLSGVTFADYSLLIIMFLLVGIFLFLKGMTRVAVFGVLAGISALFLAVELWAFDYWLGIFAAGYGVVFFVWSVYDVAT